MTVMRFTADAGLLMDITSDTRWSDRALESGRVSVVVPTRNDARTIGACLNSILAQRGVDLQVIVVDGGSVDRTLEAVRRHMDADPRVELLVSPGDTTAQLLNVGLWAARGRWLVQVDPRSTVPANYVRTLVHHLESGRWTGAGGRDEPVGATATGQAIAATASSSGSASAGSAGRVASVDRLRAGGYPTSLLRAIGGWDERLAAGEEVEMNHRLRRQGYRLMVDAGLSVSRRCAQSLRDSFAESRIRGRGLGRLLRYRIRAVASRDVFMPALLCLLVLAIPTDIVSPTMALLMAAAYPAAMIVAMIPAARRLHATAATIRVPLALLSMHAGTALGAIEGMSRPTFERLRALIPGVA